MTGRARACGIPNLWLRHVDVGFCVAVVALLAAVVA